MSTLSNNKWELSETEKENIAFTIRKDLEFNYRLPQNIITLIINAYNKTLLFYKLNKNTELALSLGIEIELIIKNSNNKDEDTIKLEIITCFHNYLNISLTSNIENLIKYFNILCHKFIKYLDKFETLPNELINNTIKYIPQYFPIDPYSSNKSWYSDFINEIQSVLVSYPRYNKEIIISNLNVLLTKITTPIIIYLKKIFNSLNILNNSIIDDYLNYINHKYKHFPNKNEFILNPESHFENGYFLHSTQYYFAKKYFQNSDNCDKLSILLANKIKQLKLSNITLVGFRSYLGMVLNKTKYILNTPGPKFDYVLLEPLKDTFTWQFLPDFTKINTNFLIILPITGTCTTYIRIRNFLQNQINTYLNVEFPKSSTLNNQENWRVRKIFINIFMVQDISILDMPMPIIINKIDSFETINSSSIAPSISELKLSKLYSSFNWARIEKDAIYFQSSFSSGKGYAGFNLIKLYSKLMPPEECINCFPSSDIREENSIFYTHDNFETPNLIQDLPNFGKPRNINNLLESQINHLEKLPKQITRLFPSINIEKLSHHYGHIKVDKSSFLYYIRGNIFFEQNKSAILEYYNSVLLEILINKPIKTINSIAFITSAGKHNSTFLEDLLTFKSQNNVSAINNWKNNGNKIGVSYDIHILRINSQNEFIENFMSSYINILQNKNTLIIYFQDIFSSGTTFKLLSNYLKHYKNISHTTKELRHGFDYIFTFIDRIPYFTREEIFKKLYSKKYKSTVNRFISFYQLNIPIVSSAHLGNPFEDKVQRLKQLIKDSHLDILRNSIGKELQNKLGTPLPEENIALKINSKTKYLNIFSTENKVDIYKINRYKYILESGTIELLKLFVTHEINNILLNNKFDKFKRSELTNLADNGKLIEYITDKLIINIENNKETFFTRDISEDKYTLDSDEREFVNDTVVKILSRVPFTYYTKIYESVFNHCLIKLEETIATIIEDPGIPYFSTLRKLKFYVRRLTELDSSSLISTRFFKLLQHLFQDKFLENKNRLELALDKIQADIRNQIEKYIIAPWINIQIELKLDSKYSLPILYKLSKLCTRLKKYQYEYLINNIPDYKTQLINYLALPSESKLDDIIFTIEEILSKLEINSTEKDKYLALTFEELTIEMQLTNLIYQYNSINSIFRLIIHSIKETSFNNYYRSIKLEEIINNNHYLPNLIIQSYKNNFNLLENLKDPYYQLTGIVKAENLYPIQKLKELHIHKYFDPDSKINSIDSVKIYPNKTDEIVNYYFNTEKNDPVIVNANKFLKKSRFYPNFPNDFENIKTSIGNMLRTSTLLLNKQEYEIHDDFIGGVHKVLKSIVSIIQPGIEPTNIEIGSTTSKLNYTLCIKYSKILEDNKSPENIYIISSNKESNGGSISSEGLIFNLINGLFSSGQGLNIDGKFLTPTDNILIGEQSFLTAVKVNNSWHSFNNEYYIYNNDLNTLENNIHKLQLNKLLEKDCKNEENDLGLPILEKSNMNLFFRLSDLDIQKLNIGNFALQGKAILIISTESVFDRSNFLQFMSNEKIRLLLLIKDEFLSYVNYITSNKAFYQLIKNEELLNYQKALKHGLEDYFGYQDKILAKKIFNNKNITVLKSLNDAIKGQINAYDLSKNIKNNIYQKEKTIERFESILESDLIAGKSITNKNYKIVIKNTQIKLDSFIYDIVILELLINAKRHSPNIKSGIEILFSTEEFSIKNNLRKPVSEENNRLKQGIEICHNICKSLNYKLNRSTENGVHIAKISKNKP